MAVNMLFTGFHGYQASRQQAGLPMHLLNPGTQQNKFTYTFHNHFHPFVSELLEKLNKQSIDGLLNADFHAKLEEHFFAALYKPNQNSPGFKVESFPKQIDVSEEGAYAVYNWELLFHVPLTIAVHLSKNQRFAEAQRWFHYIFDPTARDGKFWRFLAFRQDRDIKQIDELLHLVSKPEHELTPDERQQKKLVLSGYETLRRNPFQPHAVARTRFLAYQYCVVMKYLDNLIAWGDSLFRQDTVETQNEATQVYVLAANLLGPKPERIPPRGRIRPRTFAQLRASGLDPLGNALVELEGQLPFNLFFPDPNVDTNQVGPLFGIGRTLYFCIPRNDKLLSYWDTVADRLFKIRHCMNIEGVVRQLPLFDPPIDPGMLVKAAAAGIDISSLVSGLNQPLAPVRSWLLIQKALEICSEVRCLGAALLSALEKKDKEALSLLRQKHEINIQNLAKDLRYLQWKEAEAATESLAQSRERAVEQYRYDQRLLGRDPTEFTKVTDFTVERRELTEENFEAVYAELVGQYAQEVARNEYPPYVLAGSNSPSMQSGEEGPGSACLSDNEDKEVNQYQQAAKEFKKGAQALKMISGIIKTLPQFKLAIKPLGVGAGSDWGGSQLAAIPSSIADKLELAALIAEDDAKGVYKFGFFERRADGWRLENNLAADELMHIGRQIITSLIHEQITRHDYEDLKTQIGQAQELDEFLHDKFTNEELYGWMQGELSKLYYEHYKFAFDIARKAEQTMKHELMRPELDGLNFIKFNYWDGGRKGLLSGEALHLDLKRMEMAYHDHNKREYELTKHVSLRQLDALALLALKATGVCEVSIPEWLFDLDGPGHYMRRIKYASLSVVAETGSHTSVNCTMSLQKSTLRRSPLLRDGEYARAADGDDDRFVDYYGTIQSIVTSNAQDDSGMFETNLLAEQRFLPFEGAGAISTWRLELPGEFRQFDYDTITDVLLHVRYTARQGGAQLAQKAVEHLRELLEQANVAGLMRLFSLPQDFPTEWDQFVTGEEDFQATVAKEHFPYFVQDADIEIQKVELYAVEDKELLLGVASGLNVDDLTTALQDNHEFEVSLAEDGVLKREQEAQVFLLFRYAIR